MPRLFKYYKEHEGQDVVSPRVAKAREEVIISIRPTEFLKYFPRWCSKVRTARDAAGAAEDTTITGTGASGASGAENDG